jgi:hypothetical protein
VSTAQKAIEARGVEPVRKPKAKEICPTCKQVVPHPRNYERHKVLWALLKPALYYWPESETFQPNDTEHLRARLLVQVGWRESEDLHISGGNSRKRTLDVTLAFLNRKRPKPAVHWEQLPDGIRVFWPRSVAYNKCSEDQFKKILNKITEVIENTIGVSVEQMRREYKLAVAEDEDADA